MVSAYKKTKKSRKSKKSKSTGEKPPNPKLSLLWGYDTPQNGDAPVKDTVPLDDFVKIVTDPTINPSWPGAFKPVLIYWNRGDLNTGDEAKMVEMGIDA